MFAANPSMDGTLNCTDITIQPAIDHFNQATGPVHSDHNHFPLGSLNSGTGFPRSGRNIVKYSGMNPQVPIVTTIPDSDRSNHCNVFDLVIRPLGIPYRGLVCRGTMNSEIENIIGKNISKMLCTKIIPKLKKLCAKIL